MDTCTKVLPISKAIAFFFFRCNIAFKIVDAKAFRKVILVLRPAYAAAKFLFHRDKLHTSLLDHQYNELKATTLEQVKKAKHLRLASDGYETSDGRQFFNGVIHTAGSPPFNVQSC